MSGYVFAIVLCVAVVGWLFYLLRTRRIREKYAGIWIALAVGVMILGIFPHLALWLSGLVGVKTPVNLIFAMAFVVLLAVCIQLSAEVSNLEEETRTLAEEIALVRLEVKCIDARESGSSDQPASAPAGPYEPGPTPGPAAGPGPTPGPAAGPAPTPGPATGPGATRDGSSR